MLVAVAVFYRFYRCRDPSFLSLANITICSCSPVATSPEPNPAILICKQNTFCWFEQALGYAYNQNFFVYKRGWQLLLPIWSDGLKVSLEPTMTLHSMCHVSWERWHKHITLHRHNVVQGCHLRRMLRKWCKFLRGCYCFLWENLHDVRDLRKKFYCKSIRSEDPTK